ncbi:DUF3298 and DUF4163 domain-containing protein [Telluribacter humicola]|uniref:DUF3298 and DUF4163 domain-containing protein n=1 Tax=Telluribacter humicola TaxID=1720261 RepID=UPI001A95FB5C|nr:DUF3298 and DUF4163 domain-containing protein [Telluribacter humicola]
MKNTGIYIYSLFVILLAACTTTYTENTAQYPDTEGLNFENSTYYQSSLGECDTTGRGGVTADIKYLEPAVTEESDSQDAPKNLNNFIRGSVVKLINSFTDSTYIEADKRATTHIPEAYEAFANTYRDFKKDFPESTGCWAVELEGDTVMTTPKVVVYRLDQYSFTGGAHPNTHTGYYIFDRRNGRSKQINTFIRDSTELLRKVELAFRKHEKLPSKATLQEYGYFLPGNQFFLPANIAFSHKGMVFLYNPYEIAAYARGPIEFTIPYSEVEEMIRREQIF